MKDPRKYMRANILSLKPYATARDEFDGELDICLDANENPFNNTINRYPDPHHKALKRTMANLKNCNAENIFIGNGSDESIDNVYRVFCNPGHDHVISIAPSYGMYEVCADLNDIALTKIQLEDDFSLDTDKLLNACQPNTKVIFLCSPNNPTGNDLPYEQILDIVKRFEGIVVVDEAYIDFSAQKSLIYEVNQHQNLIVLQTLSKAYGMANLRIGFAYACAEIVETMNRVKHPYNISGIAQHKALEMLNQLESHHIQTLINEREHLRNALSVMKDVIRIYPSSANFLLIEVTDAKAYYQQFINKGIIVRDRSSIKGCENCLRITVGTPQENLKVIQVFEQGLE